MYTATLVKSSENDGVLEAGGCILSLSVSAGQWSMSVSEVLKVEDGNLQKIQALPTVWANQRWRKPEDFFILSSSFW